MERKQKSKCVQEELQTSVEKRAQSGGAPMERLRRGRERGFLCQRGFGAQPFTLFFYRTAHSVASSIALRSRTDRAFVIKRSYQTKRLTWVIRRLTMK